MIENVRRLRVLREVAATGSISGAANALGFTPSAVSQQIAALERETDVRLIEPDGRGIALTASALTLVEHAHLVLAQLERAQADLAAHARRLDGTLRLAAFASAFPTLVSGTLARLADDAPHITVRVTDAEPEQALPALAQGHFDLVLGYEYELLATTRYHGVHRRDLLDDPLLLLGLPAAETRAPVALAELSDHRWLMPPPATSCGNMVRRACEAAGFNPQPFAISPDFAALGALAVHGVGIALIPALALDATTVLRARPLEPGLHRRLFAAVRDGAQGHPVTAAAITALIATTEERPTFCVGGLVASRGVGLRTGF